MKKLIALLLALVMVTAVFAGCNKNDAAKGEDAGKTDADNAQVTANVTALEVLENTWAKYPEDQKFFAYGGDGENIVDGAPGAYSDMEGVTAQLVLPAEHTGDVKEIASLFHGMLANNFTAGAFKLADGVKADDFVAVMYDAVKNNQWMCGFPENMMIAVVEGDCVVVVFGLADVLTTFEASLKEAYPNAVIKYSEAVM